MRGKSQGVRRLKLSLAKFVEDVVSLMHADPAPKNF